MGSAKADGLRARIESLAQEYDLREVERAPYGSLAWVNGTTALVLWLRPGGVEVALTRAESLERPDAVFLPLWAVRGVRDPGTARPADAVQSMDAALEALRAHAGAVLNGDFCIQEQVARLTEEAEAAAEARLRAQGLDAALARADGLFDRGRYGEAAEHYAPLRAFLPPGRLRRLEWARSRLEPPTAEASS